MTRILCNLQECEFNKGLDIPESYENKSTTGEIGIYNGYCTNDNVEIIFRMEEIKGEYIIRHKIAECKSYRLLDKKQE